VALADPPRLRENTRDEYRRLIANYAKPYFPGRLKLVDVTPYRLARFVDWLADPDEQDKRLCDRSIANIINPPRAALATAKREGLIRHNPAQGLALPHREQIADDEQEVKVFSREQLAAVLAMAPDRHKLLFEVSRPAACGSARRSPSNAPPTTRRQRARGLHPPRSSRTASRRQRLSTAAARSAARFARAETARSPSRAARSGVDRPGLHQRGRRDDRPQQPPPPRPQAARRGGQRPLGRLPHLPPHLRLHPPQQGNQPPPTQPRARPPLSRIYAVALHAPAPRRRGTGIGSVALAGILRCGSNSFDDAPTMNFPTTNSLPSLDWLCSLPVGFDRYSTVGSMLLVL